VPPHLVYPVTGDVDRHSNRYQDYQTLAAAPKDFYGFVDHDKAIRPRTRSAGQAVIHDGKIRAAFHCRSFDRCSRVCPKFARSGGGDHNWRSPAAVELYKQNQIVM
jgi:hypothetical protein